MGSAIGMLVGAWVAHHQRVVQRRNEGIRQQISSYIAATCDLADDVVRDEEASLVDYAFLAKVNPSYRTAYEEDAKDVSGNRADLAALRPMCEKALSNVRATKDTKWLRTYLGIIEKAYQDLRNRAEESYAFSRSVAGLAGYIVSQQTAHSPSAEQPANPQ